MSKLSSGTPATAANSYGIFTLSRAAFLVLSGMTIWPGYLYGSVVYRSHYRARSAELGRRDVVRPPDEAVMSILYWIALVLTLGMFGYLLYAMLNAEKF
jgi:K+-transporting ATPase KdpF subunit